MRGNSAASLTFTHFCLCITFAGEHAASGLEAKSAALSGREARSGEETRLLLYGARRA